MIGSMVMMHQIGTNQRYKPDSSCEMHEQQTNYFIALVFAGIDRSKF
jgi:hypothetical protein